MMVMTARVDKKKLVLLLAGVAILLAGIFWLFGGSDAEPTAAASLASNDGRVAFLKDLGWDVTASPKESGQVRIPEPGDPVFDRYNELQKSQGYDLNTYGGKTVMRYVYKVKNYPGATDPVYATVLVHKNQIIGGDVTNTASGGRIQSFKKDGSVMETTTPATT